MEILKSNFFGSAGGDVDRSNKIIRINPHTFQLRVEGKMYAEGTYNQIRAVAISMDFDEVDTAMHKMVMDDHCCAMFGINRRFLYTTDRTGYNVSTKLHLVQ